MDYTSRYTGPEIDARLGLAGTALQPAAQIDVPNNGYLKFRNDRSAGVYQIGAVVDSVDVVTLAYVIIGEEGYTKVIYLAEGWAEAYKDSDNSIYLYWEDGMKCHVTPVIGGIEAVSTVGELPGDAVAFTPIIYYVKPDDGIPASDLEEGVIPDVSQFITKDVNNLVHYYRKSETFDKEEVQTLLGGKMDKVPGAVADNFAAFDGNGNVIDSNAGPGTFALAEELDTKIDRPVVYVEGNIPKFNDEGDLEDSGVSASDVSDVLAMIPAQASSSNQLADKNFVNSSIQTETASFRGTWDTFDDIPADVMGLPGETADNNDYLVVRDSSDYARLFDIDEIAFNVGDIVADFGSHNQYKLYICVADVNYDDTPDAPRPSADTNHEYWQETESNPAYEGTWRYKYVPSGSSYNKYNWLPEYQVNEKPLTAAQLAALNSNITAAKVGKLDALPTRAELTQEEQALDKVEIVTYGTKTYAELKALFDANKVVVLIDNKWNYVLQYYDSYYCCFVADARAGTRTILVPSSSISQTGEWIDQGLAKYQESNMRVSQWQETPTNSNYPSEKLVYDSLGKRGVISQTQTWTQAADGGYDYAMSDLVYGNIPQANIDLFESAGATFNSTTGYFELNGLTDISYKEMQLIMLYPDFNRFEVNRSFCFYFSEGNKPRTLLPFPNTFTHTSFGQANFTWFAYLRGFEVIKFNTACSNISNIIRQCYYVKDLGRIDISTISTSTNTTDAFMSAASLESVQIKGTRVAVSFKDSPRLSLASIVYMVENASNTSAITITLHATAYARCQADTTEYTYSGQTYTGIIALANAKNITIASV